MDDGELARFMSKVHHEPNTGCWLWVGATRPNGYGSAYVGGIRRMDSSHRVSYEHFIGAIPPGLEIDHQCRQRCCVNPDHLNVVTHAKNMERVDGRATGAHNRQKTQCPQGHPYSGNNLIIHKFTGSRLCRTCSNLRRKRYRASPIRKKAGNDE